MDKWINTRLLSSPYNWVIVISFVVLGAAMFREITRLFEAGNGYIPQVPGQ